MIKLTGLAASDYRFHISRSTAGPDEGFVIIARKLYGLEGPPPPENMGLRYHHAPARVHLQLGHGAAVLVRHPDVGPVEGHAVRVTAHVDAADNPHFQCLGTRCHSLANPPHAHNPQRPVAGRTLFGHGSIVQTGRAYFLMLD